MEHRPPLWLQQRLRQPVALPLLRPFPEFGFLKSTGIHSNLTTPSLNTSWYYRVNIWVGPAIIGPAIAGETAHASSAAGTYYFPYALQSGMPIDNELSFQVGGFQQLASKTEKIYYGSSYTIIGLGEWNIGIGNWDDDNMDSTRYLGVRFKDQENCLHYGWIRCAVVDSIDKLIVKDFAYEAQCNKAIIAGDTISYVNINNLQNSLDASVYSFNKTVFIHIENFYNVQLIISDITGKKIITKEVKNENDEINMNSYASGFYLVTLLMSEKRFDKKVMIE